jgi:hypothetical protein
VDGGACGLTGSEYGKPRPPKVAAPESFGKAYHGEPYATVFLCREAFEAPEDRAEIPAALLRQRLPQALALTQERYETIYQWDQEGIEEVKKSFTDFVELVEQKERETGRPVMIVASY